MNDIFKNDKRVKPCPMCGVVPVVEGLPAGAQVSDWDRFCHTEMCCLTEAEHESLGVVNFKFVGRPLRYFGFHCHCKPFRQGRKLVYGLRFQLVADGKDEVLVKWNSFVDGYTCCLWEHKSKKLRRKKRSS